MAEPDRSEPDHAELNNGRYRRITMFKQRENKAGIN